MLNHLYNADLLRVLFWGYHDSAEVCLRTLLNDKRVVVLGVVVPDKKPMKKVQSIVSLSKDNNIIIFSPSECELKSGFFGKLSLLDLDLIVVDSYPYLIPQEIIDLPKLGAYNFHEGKLPEYRGAHVMNWALINGESKIFLTLHQMDAKFDTGPVVSEKSIQVGVLDDINSIYDQLCRFIPEMVASLVSMGVDGNIISIPQNISNAAYFHLRTPEDGRIDWNDPTKNLIDMIRALRKPWPGAFTYNSDERIVIHEAYILSEYTEERNGTVIESLNKRFLVSSFSTVILVTDFEGRLPSKGDFLG